MKRIIAWYCAITGLICLGFCVFYLLSIVGVPAFSAVVIVHLIAGFWAARWLGLIKFP